MNQIQNNCWDCHKPIPTNQKEHMIGIALCANCINQWIHNETLLNSVKPTK